MNPSRIFPLTSTDITYLNTLNQILGHVWWIVQESDMHAKWLKAHLSQRARSYSRPTSSSQREEKQSVNV